MAGGSRRCSIGRSARTASHPRSRTVADADTGAGSLTVVASSSDPALVRATISDTRTLPPSSRTTIRSTGAASEWLFAEGAQGSFSTFFLLFNPHDTANMAHVVYLREDEPPLTRDYSMAPHARVTVEAATDLDLINRAFGARVRFDQPGAAERAMYSNANGVTWAAGTNATATRLP